MTPRSVPMRSSYKLQHFCVQANGVTRQFQLVLRCAASYRNLVFATVCMSVLVVLSGCEKKQAPPPPGPPEVLVAEVAQQNVPIFQEWVSQITGPVNADITPKVQGYLLRQNYQNG